MRSILIINLFCIYTFIPAFSQSEYVFKQLTTNDGLSNNTVLSIAQDNSGCIWFATYDGLSVYDSNQFRILRYDPLKGNNGLSKGQAQQMEVDRYGNKWILFENNQLVRIQNVTDNCKHYYVNRKINSSCKLIKDSKGNMVFQSDSLYYSYKQETDDFSILENNSEIISKIRETRKKEDVIAKMLVQKSADVNIFAIYINEEYDKIAVSTTNSGVWIKTDRKNAQFQNYRNFKSDKNKIPSDEIYCSFIDREGNLWLGTKDAGVILGQKVDVSISADSVIWKSNDAGINGTIRAIVRDDNNILLGTYNNGVVEYQNNRIIHYSYKKQYGEKWDWIRSLFRDSQGNIWIGSYGGVVCASSDFHSIKPYFPDSDQYSIHQNRIYSITEDKSGCVFFGAWGGIDMFCPDNNLFADVDSLLDLPRLNVRKLMFDSNGFLWIGTENLGVYKVDVHNRMILSHFVEDGKNENQISSNSVFDICQDSEGNIYLGTFGGVNKINIAGDVDRLIGLNDQLPTTLVYKLFWTEDNSLWFSTSKCIAKYFPSNKTVRIYDCNDGFPISDYTEGAGYQGKDGSLFFGGNNGVMGFKPENIRENPILPVLYVKDLSTDRNKPPLFSNDSVYTFSALTKQVDIQLSSVMLNQPGKTTIAWKLVPFENKFSIKNSQLAKLQYSNLPSGSYSLIAKVSNADHIWSEPTTIVSFNIPKPLWETTFFYVCTTILVILIILVVLRIRFQRMKQKNILLEQLIEQRTEKINNQKQDLEKAFIELEDKNAKVLVQRDKILAQHAHLLEMHSHMEELNLLKQKFFTNVSHDIRTPLTLISGPLSELIQDKSLDNSYKETLERMKYNVNYIVQLLDQVLDKKSLELGGLQRIMTQGDIVNVCKSAINSFQDQVNINRLNLKFSSSHESLYIRFDFDKFQQIVYNIIANAVKFTSQGGTISCDLQIQESNIYLTISDTGIGMSPDSLEFIFDRYYQINKSSQETKGSGIGLSMVKDFVHLLGGEIKVESEPGKGSIFLLSFTIESSQNLTLLRDDNSTSDLVTERKNEIISEKKSAILVVEDNAQLRLYLKQLLSKKYKIITAENGLVAQEILRKNKAFNLIISDWMMSQMDGITLCRYVKKKDSLNHIPFLILSALGQVKNQKEGYLAGADDYISKPFEPEILFLKVDNLINRQKTAEHSAIIDAMIQPEITKEKSFDEKLVLKINEVLNENIANTEFNQHILAEKLGLSQMQLYRKTKSKLLQTPNDLIRSARIKKAKSLLCSNSEFTINEVSYMSGFNDPKYFSRCFTKEFGMSPTEFKNEQHCVEIN